MCVLAHARCGGHLYDECIVCTRNTRSLKLRYTNRSEKILGIRYRFLEMNRDNTSQNGFFYHQQYASAQQQLTLICGAKQLAKLKRFLTSLYSISSKASPKVHLQVTELCLSLVVRIAFLCFLGKTKIHFVTFQSQPCRKNGAVSVEEYYERLQQILNNWNIIFKPFLIPLLKVFLRFHKNV